MHALAGLANRDPSPQISPWPPSPFCLPSSPSLIPLSIILLTNPLLPSSSQVIGTIDGSGRVKLVDKNAPPGTPPAVDLDLDKVLGKMPDKTYTFTRDSDNKLAPLVLPAGTEVMTALHRVLKLPAVCSKRFLTTKVDRHVTGEGGRGCGGFGAAGNPGNLVSAFLDSE